MVIGKASVWFSDSVFQVETIRSGQSHVPATPLDKSYPLPLWGTVEGGPGPNYSATNKIASRKYLLFALHRKKNTHSQKKAGESMKPPLCSATLFALFWRTRGCFCLFLNDLRSAFIQLVFFPFGEHKVCHRPTRSRIIRAAVGFQVQQAALLGIIFLDQDGETSLSCCGKNRLHVKKLRQNYRWWVGSSCTI